MLKHAITVRFNLVLLSFIIIHTQYIPGRLKDISTPDFSTPSFRPRSVGLKGPGLKLGVEKSGVEISFNHSGPKSLLS